MLKIKLVYLPSLVLFTVVLGYGIPNIFAQGVTGNNGTVPLEVNYWETYYNPKYRFSIDYPIYDDKTSITEQGNGTNTSSIIFNTPAINYTVTIYTNKNTSDPQELAVANMQNLTIGQVPTIDGVTSIYQDNELGYKSNVVDISPAVESGYILIYDYLYFKHNGLVYKFTFTNNDSAYYDEVEVAINSIKFFD